MKLRLLLISWLCVLGVQAMAAGAEDALESATRRGLAQVTRAGNNWLQNKSCFSCHHQTLPMFAVTEAARAGIQPDPAWLKAQADNAHEYFEERSEDMDQGDHVPGGAATAAYGLWALSLDKRPSDQITTSMVAYLLQIQGVQRLKPVKTEVTQPKDGRWIASCRRPPLQGSEISDTVIVLLGLEKYASAEQRAGLAMARVAAEKYLTEAKLRNQQDRLWRLWGLHQLKGDAEAKAKLRAAILKQQRPDGGWSQNDRDEASDAFSTGQTLFMLCQTGTAKDDPVALRARDYLLKTQHADGSWRVESRVKFKAQPYFDNGDPYGEHQFISTAATCWATAALAQLRPTATVPTKPGE